MGTKRAPRGSAGNLANFKSLWDDPATGSASADVSMTAANMPPSASQQTPRSFHNYPDGGNPTGNAPAHIAWPAYNTLEGYHQYYEPQSSPYGAQWAQAYHPT